MQRGKSVIDDIIRMLISLNSQLEKYALILKTFLGFDCRKWPKLQKLIWILASFLRKLPTLHTYHRAAMVGSKTAKTEAWILQNRTWRRQPSLLRSCLPKICRGNPVLYTNIRIFRSLKAWRRRINGSESSFRGISVDADQLWQCSVAGGMHNRQSGSSRKMIGNIIVGHNLPPLVGIGLMYLPNKLSPCLHMFRHTCKRCAPCSWNVPKVGMPI